MSLREHISEILSKILKTLVVYTLVYLILISAGWTLATGEFPPKLSSLKKSYENIKQLSKASDALLAKLDSAKAGGAAPGGLGDLNQMQALLQNQLKEIKKLGAEQNMGVSAQALAEATTAVESAEKVQLDRLQQQIAQMRIEINQLKTQVNGLKGNSR